MTRTPTITTCDVCGKQVTTEASNPVVGPNPLAGWFTIKRTSKPWWIGSGPVPPDRWDVCGNVCLHKLDTERR